jgi:hypothetical protein
MLRTIGAVLAGYVAIGVLIFGTDQLFAALIPGFSSMAMPPDYYFAASVATDTAYSIGGGYLCARIAQAGIRSATIGLMVFGELMGLASTVYLWKTVPHWYSFALLLLYPPAVWIGSRLSVGRRLVNP